jgi:FtsP/CotA-like multicopper oxidase with cupredoxin domain
LKQEAAAFTRAVFHFYHTHIQGDRQQPLGLYGAFVIDDLDVHPDYSQEYIVELGEWRVADGQTYPAMDFDGMLPNFFTINGKSFPATETIEAKVGARILSRFIGSGQFIRPHAHPRRAIRDHWHRRQSST